MPLTRPAAVGPFAVGDFVNYERQGFYFLTSRVIILLRPGRWPSNFECLKVFPLPLLNSY